MIPRFADHPRQIKSIIEAVLRAADPAACVRRAAKGMADVPSRPALLSIGKAAAAMDEGWRDARGDAARSFMVLPTDAMLPPSLHHAMWVHRSSHPIPDDRSVAAGRLLAEFVDACSRSADIDGFVVLLSGGASSLIACPDDGLTVHDLADVSRRLMRAGADIRALNTVRKHLDQLKGGRLASRMAPKPVLALVLSDVVGDDLSVIGSGPLVPDPTTFADAKAVLERYKVDMPAVTRVIEDGCAGRRPETPKSGGTQHAVRHSIVGSNLLALQAAQTQIQTLGFEGVDVFPEVVGPAHVAGEKLSKLAVKRRAAGKPWAILLGGECTVNVAGAAGIGGRNQELALAAAIALDGADRIAVAAFATDGVDGSPPENSPAPAGAMVTGRTCLRARSLAVSPAESLQGHDSYGFFSRLDRAGQPHLIATGPTGTNVNDVAFALVYPGAW